MAPRGTSSSKAAKARDGSRATRRKVAGAAHRTALKDRERDETNSSAETDSERGALEAVTGEAEMPRQYGEFVSGADSGQTGDAATTSGETEAREDSAEGTSTTRRGWRMSRVARVRALIGLLVASLVATGYFVVATVVLYSGPARNAAIVDAAATKKVSGDVSQALRAAFSYDHAHPEATEQEARQALTGEAVQQYSQLFGQVKKVAPQQRLVLSSAVRSIGVTRLDDERAQLVAFVDQQGVRGDSNQRRSGTAQLSVSAVRSGNTWKVDDITVL